MNLNDINGFTLIGLSKTNVMLGKNGCGKSHLFKQIERGASAIENVGKVSYLTPERGGVLNYAPNIEEAISGDVNWLRSQRRQNQTANFRQQSATLFRRLELSVLRKIENDHTSPEYEPTNFNVVVDQLNELLDRVKLRRHGNTAFEIIDRKSGKPTKPEAISSGESELISLGIEILSFAREAENGKSNFLLIDEPDVHLHPDLQDRLARFVLSAFATVPVTVLIATHSTPILASLSDDAGTTVAFMKAGDTQLVFRPVTEIHRAVVPIFGAHPLSNVFNETSVLLVEGEDDERIWQQAARSSEGKLRLFPRYVGSIDKLGEYEIEVNEILGAIYDDATGFSLRDRDESSGQLDDLEWIVRMRLECRTAENLMLTDDCLALMSTDWESFKTVLVIWADSNTDHQYHAEVKNFVDNGSDRRNHDLKNIRNILIGLASNKPWEVVVGQAIAKLVVSGGEEEEGSLRSFLGAKVCLELLDLESK